MKKDGCVVILSGGMDSTILMRLCVEKFGADSVHAITFFYGQRQDIEIAKAAESTKLLGVKHQIVDLAFFGRLAQGFSANVDHSIEMPTIQDVLGDPAPKTYLPNRNMILMSIAAAYAEVCGFDEVYIGLQCHDMYSYHDTTERFLDKINDVLNENRKHKVTIQAPFIHSSKTEELNLLLEVDGNLNLLEHTLTCYDPDKEGRSCGKCPSCAERLKAFENIGRKDVIEYV
jgi:7-cyano-7-deazaguanine synthase